MTYLPGYSNPIIVRKLADETVNNSAVLQDDDHLLLPVVANARYIFEIQLLLSSPNGTADWKFGWTFPTGTTMFWGAQVVGTGSTTLVQFGAAFDSQAPTTLWDQATVAAIGGAAITGGFHARGVIRAGGTAGNVKLQWAQNTANASDSKLLADSVLIAHRIA
jgi:hypothetical protein